MTEKMACTPFHFSTLVSRNHGQKMSCWKQWEAGKLALARLMAYGIGIGCFHTVLGLVFWGPTWCFPCFPIFPCPGWGVFSLSAKAAFSGRCGSLQITFQLAAIEAPSIMGLGQLMVNGRQSHFLVWDWFLSVVIFSRLL